MFAVIDTHVKNFMAALEVESPAPPSEMCLLRRIRYTEIQVVWMDLTFDNHPNTLIQAQLNYL